MANDQYNPIQSVTPCNRFGVVTGQAVTALPVPSVYVAKVIDVSAPDAGRTEDGATNKMRMGQSIRLDIEWAYPTRSEVERIMSAFNSEYIRVEYLDPREADSYLVKRFYVGDRNAPLWNSTHGRWERLTFGIIQQNIDVV